MTWKVLGSGPLADSMRAELARDPDRYRAETWSMSPEGRCQCCDEEVFRCTTRHTGWIEGFATHKNHVHPRVDANGQPDPSGAAGGCCCVPPNFGPKHAEPKRRRRK